MGAYSGALVRAYAVDRPAPLGRANPYAHDDANGEGTDRDSAPRGGGWQPSAWDVTEYDAGLPASSRTDDGFAGGHGDDSGHDTRRESISQRGTRAAWLDYTRAEIGTDNPPATLNYGGSGGAANGGLRADNSKPWANPDGYDLGHDPTPRNTVRKMGRWLTHSALRPAPLPNIESGTAGTGDPAGLGRYTSPFDSGRDARTWGPQQPTVRRILRPYGDTDFVDADEAPQTAADSTSGGWAL